MSRRRNARALVLVLAWFPRPLAADEYAAPLPLTATQLVLHQYVYVDFPRQLEAVNSAIAFAEKEVLFASRRVDSYRPFRSFGRYAATYTADQAAQLHLLFVQQQLHCLRRQKSGLWQERQALVAAMLQEPQP
jgi:hypothetical protein